MVAILVACGDAVPSWRMTIADAVLLAKCKRGIAPIRITIMPQAAASTDADEPMPVLF